LTCPVSAEESPLFDATEGPPGSGRLPPEMLSQGQRRVPRGPSLPFRQPAGASPSAPRRRSKRVASGRTWIALPKLSPEDAGDGAGNVAAHVCPPGDVSGRDTEIFVHIPSVET
jgi:hypothetical protein